MNQELLANMPALALSFKVGRAALDGNAANRLSALDFDSAGLWFAALASCGLRSVLLTLLDSDLHLLVKTRSSPQWQAIRHRGQCVSD